MAKIPRSRTRRHGGAATARGVERWVKLADARGPMRREQGGAGADGGGVAEDRREGRAMCAAAFGDGGSGETRDRLDFRTAARRVPRSARRRQSGCVQTRPETCREMPRRLTGDPLDLDAVADALSAPVEALGAGGWRAAAAKYAGGRPRDGDEVSQEAGGEGVRRGGRMIDAARGRGGRRRRGRASDAPPRSMTSRGRRRRRDGDGGDVADRRRPGGGDDDDPPAVRPRRRRPPRSVTPPPRTSRRATSARPRGRRPRLGWTRRRRGRSR